MPQPTSNYSRASAARAKHRMGFLMLYRFIYARIGAMLLLASAAVFTLPVSAQGSDLAPIVARDRNVSDIEQRAEALLHRAVEHIKINGKQGVADFSRRPDFVDRDLYVYALATDGLFLGSGGWSASLTGQNVLQETDTQGKHFFRDMIDIAKKDGYGEIQYHWFNPADSRDEPKVTEFVAVEDVIVAVGYFPPRGTATQAKAIFKKALNALADNPQAAINEFQQVDGPYIYHDLYVFVVDTKTQKFLAHGGSPSLVGTNAYDLLDANGQHVVKRMAEIAEKDTQGELNYSWLNPMTGRIENKHTQFRLIDGLLLGVGRYGQ